MQGAEEDLLALYLHDNRSFPKGPDMYILDPDLWDQFVQKDEYKRKKAADRDSYIWDALIEEMGTGKAGPSESGSSLSQDERGGVYRSVRTGKRFPLRMLVALSVQKSRSIGSSGSRRLRRGIERSR